MYKIAKTFRSQHVVEALDGDGDLARAVQRSSYKKPLEVVAACLAPPTPTATAARARAATPGADLGTDSGDTLAAQLLLGVGGGHHSASLTVVEVSLGTIVNRNGIEGATTAAMTMRCDELGKPFEPGTFGVSEANENINRNLAGQGMKRKGTCLFVVRADGGLTVVMDNSDLLTGWLSAPPSTYVDGTMRLHLAIRLLPPAGVTAATAKKKGKKEWDVRGSGTGVDYDDDEGVDEDEGEGADSQSFDAKRRRVNVLVEAFWRRMGWASDAGLMAYHTQHICKDRDDMADTLDNKEVTTVPRKWPYDREPQPLRHAAAAAAASSSSSSSTTSETPGEALAVRLTGQMMQQMIQQQQQQQTQVIPNTPGAPAAPADKEYPAAPATAAPTPAERMVTLGEWLRGGVIDENEYKAKKQKILGDL
jgi:hypothetical protein